MIAQSFRAPGAKPAARGGRVILHPECGDDIASYQTEPAPADAIGVKSYGTAARYMLLHKDNMDCIYLGNDGCTIWDRAPAMCKEFDCRKRAVGDHDDIAIG